MIDNAAQSPRLRLWGRTLPRLSLKAALALAIAVSILLVTLGYLLYLRDGNYKYDLARPGDNNKNQALEIDETEVNDTTTPVDVAALKGRLDFLDEELAALKAINRFDAQAVTDDALQLDPQATPSF